MTEIYIKIDLSRYSPSEIIGLCEQGIITVREIIDSGVVPKVFGPELGDYVKQKLREEKTCVMVVN